MTAKQNVRVAEIAHAIYADAAAKTKKLSDEQRKKALQQAIEMMQTQVNFIV
jgi:hypothetical protein